jgi:hypothetical protein
LCGAGTERVQGGEITVEAAGDWAGLGNCTTDALLSDVVTSLRESTVKRNRASYYF